MPDPCEALMKAHRAAYDEYQRLLVQSHQSGTVAAGSQDFVKIKLLRPDLVAQVEEAKAKLPAAEKRMKDAAARLEECQRISGV